LTLYKDQGYCLIFNINYQSKIGFCKHISIVYDDKSPIITLVTEEVDEQYIANLCLILFSNHIIDDNIQNLVYSYPGLYLLLKFSLH